MASDLRVSVAASEFLFGEDDLSYVNTPAHSIHPPPSVVVGGVEDLTFLSWTNLYDECTRRALDLRRRQIPITLRPLFVQVKSPQARLCTAASAFEAQGVEDMMCGEFLCVSDEIMAFCAAAVGGHQMLE